MTRPPGNAGNVAVVAGAGGGLGHATTQVLAAAGYTVVGLDRSGDAMADLDAAARREIVNPADPAAVTDVIDRIAAEVGPPGVLVNTVGAFRPGGAADTSQEMLRLMLDVNLAPALWLSNAVAPHMRARGSGAIVHVTARPGVEPTAGFAAYGVSKAALAHLTRSLDLELRPQGIRVNAVAPQLIATEANRATFPPDVLAKAVAPEAIAAVIAFLVSPDAAPVSGAILPAYGASG
jgi:NAD(P)-dependent dehydrogenase (short-subunit alcohol dehydrogenase family)